MKQLDLFPERVFVEQVDPRTAGGRSQVRAMFIVTFERQGGRHQVFHDQHGWYCADHGPACGAVREVRSRHPRGRLP